MIASLIYGVVVSVHEAIDLTKEGGGRLQPIQLIVAIPLSILGCTGAFIVNRTIKTLKG